MGWTSAALGAAALLAVALMGGPTGCSSAGNRGELTVVLSTDLAPPKDFDRIDVELDHHGTTVTKSYAVPGDTKLPATLGIASVDDDPITIRVHAYANGTNIITREAVTTVPSDRNVALWMPVDWLCEEPAPNLPCPSGQTCVGGACVSSSVDSSALKDFSHDDVFGGPSSNCVDVAACFASAPVANRDLTSCTAPLPQGVTTPGVAIKLPAGSQGICTATACFVPLDADSDDGWQSKPGAIGLPAGVCARLTAGDALDIVTSTTCQKIASTPTCGAWSSVGNPGQDGGVAAPVALITALPESVTSLTVDDANVYFATADSISSVPVAGGSAASVATGLAGPQFIATDAAYVYWGISGVSISRAPVGGGAPQQLATAPSPNGPIAIDATNVYWLTSSNGVLGWTLSSVPKSGGGVQTVASETSSGSMGTPFWFSDLLVSGGNAFFRVMENGFSQGVYSVSLPGGTVSNRLDPYPGTLGGDAAAVGSLWLAASSDYFWIAGAQGVFSAPLDASSVSLAGTAYGLTQDGAHVYWAIDMGNSGVAVQRQALTGGAVDTLTTVQSPPLSLSTNGKSLFWYDASTSSIVRLDPPP